MPLPCITYLQSLRHVYHAAPQTRGDLSVALSTKVKSPLCKSLAVSYSLPAGAAKPATVLKYTAKPADGLKLKANAGLEKQVVDVQASYKPESADGCVEACFAALWMSLSGRGGAGNAWCSCGQLTTGLATSLMYQGLLDRSIICVVRSAVPSCGSRPALAGPARRPRRPSASTTAFRRLAVRKTQPVLKRAGWQQP